MQDEDFSTLVAADQTENEAGGSETDNKVTLYHFCSHHLITYLHSCFNDYFPGTPKLASNPAKGLQRNLSWRLVRW